MLKEIFVSFEEHLGFEEDQSEQTCDWCGKEGVSVWWSGIRGKYCSFRCSAAGSYHRTILITICIIALQSLFEFIIITMALNHQDISALFIPMFFLPNVLVTLGTLSFVYMVYVGHVMRKKRESSELVEQVDEIYGGPDAI
jgi:hypothetical protein